MTLRKRVSFAAAGAVALTVALAMVVCYGVLRSQLRGQIDSELKGQEQQILGEAYLGSSYLPALAAQGGAAPYEMLVSSNRSSQVNGQRSLTLPVTAAARAVAKGATNAYVLTDASVDGVHLRVLIFHDLGRELATSGSFNGEEVTIPIAVELARPLTQVDNVLTNLRLVLAVLFLACIALAAGLGRMAARRVLAPLAEVTDTAQAIGETDNLSLRLAVHADDEVGQLATRFNEMLERLEDSRDALDDSVRSQRQLVADASHELRTPVTSLRTNIEVLLAGGALDEEDRRRLLADVVEQSEELTTLVSDLIEVARGDLPSGEVDELRLDAVAEACLARARRNSPDVTFVAHLSPTIVTGNPERLTRAINNLLDNAARHTSPGGPVELTVDTAGVRVRDHGNGIDDADLPHVFDRFYRGVNSRSRQGSGLGLAIVRQVAEQHGGSAAATNAPDGGALFTIALPGTPAPADNDGGDDGDEEDVTYGAGGFATRA
jgi:two-component system, OmpR family, sensor histidine kinase MprB